MTALYIILIIIAAVLVLATFAGKEMNVEQNIVINQPKDTVFDFVKYVKNHDHFSVWAMMDPDMKREYKGVDGQEGFVFAWDSSKEKNVGAGEQEIKKIEEGKLIAFELRFLRPMQDVCQAIMITEAVGANQTEVKWGFYSTMKFPMNIMKPLVQGMLTKNLETGLTNLKNHLER